MKLLNIVKIALFLPMIMGSLQVYADSKGECISDLKQRILERDQNLQQDYRELDLIQGKIRTKNSSQLLIRSSDTATLLLHGFMASPFEVAELGAKIQESGTTVYMPLVRGFGSSVKVANSVQFEQWRTDLIENIEILGRCFKTIHLAGFSNGGTLITDFLLNNPKVDSAGLYDHRIRIKSAVAVSPYYGSSHFYLDLLNSFLIYTPLLDEKSVSISELYFFTKNPDLKAAVNNPLFYNSKFPLLAAQQVNDLGKRILESKTHSNVPFFAVYTQSDKTIDIDLVPKVLDKNFSNHDAFYFMKAVQHPHQLLIKSVNSEAEDLERQIVNFIRD